MVRLQCRGTKRNGRPAVAILAYNAMRKSCASQTLFFVVVGDLATTFILVAEVASSCLLGSARKGTSPHPGFGAKEPRHPVRPPPFRLVVINLKHKQGRVQLRIVGRVCCAGSVPHPAAQCSATEPQRRCLSVPRQPAGSTRAATADSDSLSRLAHSKSVPTADAHLIAFARDMLDHHHERTRSGYSATSFFGVYRVPRTAQGTRQPCLASACPGPTLPSYEFDIRECRSIAFRPRVLQSCRGERDSKIRTKWRLFPCSGCTTPLGSPNVSPATRQ